MDELDLTDEEQRVYGAVAALETERGGVRADEVAREVDIDAETVRATLSRLTSERDLLRELSPGDPDLGPHYRIKDTAASA